MVMSRARRVAEFIGFIPLSTGYFVMLICFFSAYRTDMIFTAPINSYGEAFPEMLYLLFSFPLVLYAMGKWIIRFVLEKEEV